jgi:hypothetical protein
MLCVIAVWKSTGTGKRPSYWRKIICSREEAVSVWARSWAAARELRCSMKPRMPDSPIAAICGGGEGGEEGERGEKGGKDEPVG